MVKLRSNKHVAFDPKLSGSNWETKLREFNDRKGTMVKNVEASNERNHHLSALLSPSSAGGSRSKQQRQTHSRSKQQKQTHVEGPFEPRRKRKRHPSDSGPLLLSSGHSKAPPQAPPRTLRLTRSSAPRVDHSFIGDDGERYYRCSHFGINRKVTYQSENFFWCSHCDWLDDAVTAEPNKTFDMTSKTFQCSAKHTSVIFPTQRVDRPNWLCYGYTKSSDRGGGDCGDFSGSDNDHDNDDNEDCGDHGHDTASSTKVCPTTTHNKAPVNRMSGAGSRGVTSKECMGHKEVRKNSIDSYHQDDGATIAALMRENSELKARVVLLETTMKALEHRNIVLTKYKDSQMAWEDTILSMKEGEVSADEQQYVKAGNLAQMISDFSDVVYAFQRRRSRAKKKTKAMAMVKAMMTNDLLDGHVKRALLGEARQWYRKYVYSPRNILRAMDLNGGKLSYSGLEVLRLCETGGKKGMRAMIPSSGTMSLEAKRVEAIARKFAPFKIRRGKDAEDKPFELLEFDMRTTAQNIVIANGLDEVAKTRPVGINCKFDGCNVTRGKSVVNFVVSPADKDMIPPLSRVLYNAREAIGTEEEDIQFQSVHHCYPLAMGVMKEKRDNLRETSFFKEVLSWGLPESHVGPNASTVPLPQNPLNAAWRPFEMGVGADNSGHQKGLLRGGGCKVSHYFCIYCSSLSRTCHQPNSSTCGRWCSQHTDKPKWKCYHGHVFDGNYIESLKTEMNEIIHELQADATKYADSRLKILDSPIYEQIGTKDSIYFETDDLEAKMQFVQDVHHELGQRDESTSGSIVELRERLLVHLEVEKKLTEILHHLEKGSPDENALYMIFQALPCILHLETRVGLKIFEMILMKGQALADEGTLHPEIKSFKQYIKYVENKVNKDIMYNNNDCFSWKYPVNEDGTKTAPMKMTNMQVRAFMDKMGLIIDVCIADPDDQCKWKEVVNYHRDAMEILRSKHDLEDSEIRAYQKACDEFAQRYIDLTGNDGMTNYIHMVAAGHISEFLFRWRNLYRHSQQGLEALNNMMKNVVHRRTQRGGNMGRGHGSTRHSFLLPIGRWTQRRIWFLLSEPEDTGTLGLVMQLDAATELAPEFEDDGTDIHDIEVGGESATI